MRIKPAVAVVGAALLMATFAGCSSSESDSAATTTAASDSGSTSNNAGDGGSDSSGGEEATTATLPAGWLDELELPEDTTVIQATDSGTQMSVVARIDGDTKTLFDALESELEDAGYQMMGSNFTPSDEGGFGSISAKGDTHTVAIAFGPDPTGTTSQVTINVAEVA